MSGCWRDKAIHALSHNTEKKRKAVKKHSVDCSIFTLHRAEKTVELAKLRMHPGSGVTAE